MVVTQAFSSITGSWNLGTWLPDCVLYHRVGRQSNGPQRCPQTCEYITSCGKRDFPGVIKVMDLELGRLSQTIQVITWLCKSRESLSLVRWRRTNRARETWEGLSLLSLAWKRQEGGHEPRNVIGSRSREQPWVSSHQENGDLGPTTLENWILLTAQMSTKQALS